MFLFLQNSLKSSHFYLLLAMCLSNSFQDFTLKWHLASEYISKYISLNSLLKVSIKIQKKQNKTFFGNTEKLWQSIARIWKEGISIICMTDETELKSTVNGPPYLWVFPLEARRLFSASSLTAQPATSVLPIAGSHCAVHTHQCSHLAVPSFIHSSGDSSPKATWECGQDLILKMLHCI